MTVWDKLSYVVVGLLVAAALAAAFFLYLPLFQTNNQLRRQIYALDAKILEQERLKARLKATFDAVQKDPRTIERLARGRLGFARSNETVFVFEPPRSK